MKPALGVIFGLAVLSSHAFGQDTRPGVGQSGRLEAIQFANADPGAVLEAWGQSEQPSRLQGDGRMKRGDPMFTFVLFHGCAINLEGLCNVTADFEVKDPEGRPYVEQKDVRTWVDRAPAPGSASMLGVGYMGLVVEKRDRIGRYRVLMTLIDHVAGVSLHTEQVLTVVE